MPPKRKPEQHNKNASSKSRSDGFTSRSSRAKSTPKPGQSAIANPVKSIPSWRLPKNASAADYKTKIETLWKTMGNSRVGERQNAIKDGLIADPNKRTTLANAIRVVGTCQDMCPEFERIQRIRENAVDKAEKTSIYNGSKIANELRMVKAFHRPDAGKEEQLPSDLRPPPVLQKTVRYLFDEVASPSSSLAEHHKFVWDRTRCIRNDFTIQASGRLEDIKIAIQCYEEIARFHILSLHQMPKIGKHDYDAQQELEQLSATLLSLFEFYDDNRGKYEAPHEAEFRAYKLLIDIRSRTSDTFERVQTLPPRIRDSFHVQTAVQLCQASGQILTDTASMLSPYSRATRIEQAAYEKFWTILESPKVDYLMACAAAVSFNEVRARALETMAKVYRSGPQSRMQDISLEELAFALGLDSKSQTRKLFRESGLHVSKHANGVSYLNLDELSGALPKSAISSARQIFSRSIVEAKRNDRVFSAIYNGFDLAYCKENGLIDELESDAEFEPDAADLDSEDEEDPSLFVDQGEDEDVDEMTDTLAPGVGSKSNPFASSMSREGSPLPEKPFFGGFGQPSTALPSGAVAKTSSNNLAPTNPFANSQAIANPFTKVGQSTTSSFGASILGQNSSVFNRPQGHHSPSEASQNDSSSGTTLFSIAAKPIMNPAASLFQPKTGEVPMSASQQILDEPGKEKQIYQQPGSTMTNTQNDGRMVEKKPLFPFTFPPASKSEPPTSFKDTNLPSQESKPLFSSKSAMFPSPPFAVPSFSHDIEPHSTTTHDRQMPSSIFGQPKIAAFPIASDNAGTAKPLTPMLDPFGSYATDSILPSETSTTTTPEPRLAEISNQSLLGTKAEVKAVPKASEVATAPSVELTAAMKQQQKDKIVDIIAKELVTIQYGILEQFIEAQLGPIYDKAQRKVTKERIKARLEEIKHDLLGMKYLYVWKKRSEARIQKRKAVERRERMRQSQREGYSREQSVSEASISSRGDSTSELSNGQLKYLTRGFHETFDKSLSDKQSSLHGGHPLSFTKGFNEPNITVNRAKDSTITSFRQAGRSSRHSRSQTDDGIARTSVRALTSTSMPPPDRLSISRGLTRSRNSELKSFVGTGFLQNAALRRDAMDFARRSGSNTTTASDYFRLKARKIDPDTKAIPSTKKRSRDSGDNSMDGLMSKSRRMSESSTSTLSLSESARELLAKSNLSESARSLINGQSNHIRADSVDTINPRYTDDEEALFEAARKLRETLAEDTSWMKSMREEQHQDEGNQKRETAAEKRLRDFKMTPSKTSLRLRQTHANGLLPPDYFERQDAAKDKRGDKQGLQKDIVDSAPKMGLAALSEDRHSRKSKGNAPRAPSNGGASLDDAIEL